MIDWPLKYYNERATDISMLVIHSMAHDAIEGIESLEKYQLSAHYVIDYDGTIFKCVDEKHRAWHAGLGSWKGMDDINSRSIGIEVCHKSLGQSAFNKRQVKSLINLCQDILKRNKIRSDMVVGHSDIAPTRKPDPGKAFPWKELAKNGVGLWFGNEKSAETDLKKLLETIGYNTTNLEAAKYAFMRHFLPQYIATMGVKKLVNHPYPKNTKIKDNDILEVLQKTAYSYKKEA